MTKKKLMDWLSVETKGIRPILGYVLLAALVVVSLDQCVQAALINWGVIKSPPMPQAGDSPFKYYNGLMFAEMFVTDPLMEELIFRVLPLVIVIGLISKSPRFVFGVTAVFAVLFGAIHPYNLHWKIQAAISGFFFGLVFLKCGGLNKRFVKASVSAIAAHGVTNLFVVLYEWWQFVELTS